MNAENVACSGWACFRAGPVGFGEVQSFNILVGRNNSGKTRLLDLVTFLTRVNLSQPTYATTWEITLTEPFLQRMFPSNHSGGPIPGNHWAVGKRLIGRRVRCSLRANAQNPELEFIDNDDATFSPAVMQVLSQSIAAESVPIFTGRPIRWIASERDIVPEGFDSTLQLLPDGQGATNIISSFYNKASLDREFVRTYLLRALQEILSEDANLTEIITRQLDTNAWEVFLVEDGKGPIALSMSGSGLKTILLVLLNFIFIEEIDRIKQRATNYVYVFEELENNLHPALLRRLLDYIKAHVRKMQTYCFITTHSPTVLDYFSALDDAQIISVSRDGAASSSNKIGSYFAHTQTLSELGARPSDLLQANGILWIEGPSDRIYLNRWIELFADGEFVEGKHYQCACYGGALIAKSEFVQPEDIDKEKLNLLRLNNNVFVMCDSDRTSKNAQIKPRVRRVEAEVNKIPGGLIWVTGAKEVENYLPKAAIEACLGRKVGDAPGRYERFFPSKTPDGTSYIERVLSRKSLDKVEFAIEACRNMTRGDLETRFDLPERMAGLISTIRLWNR